MSRLRVLAVLLFLCFSCADSQTVAKLQLLPNNTAGKCLDGSPGAFYFAPATNATNTDKWVFSLEGGGECVTQQSCQARAQTDLGSSKGYGPTAALGQFQDPDPSNNPVMHDWNMVFIKYCSGDLFSGQTTVPSDSTWGLYFSGHLVVGAVLDFLSSPDFTGPLPLSKSSIIVFSGDSAGGIGTFTNLDYVADRFPLTRVLGAPIAGFYFPAYPYTGPNAAPIDVPFDPASWPVYYALWKAFVPTRCAAANPSAPWLCALANTSVATLNAPLFVVETQTDRVSMGLHDGINANPPFSAPILQYVTAWGRNMSIGLEAVESNPTSGLFNPACWIHTDFWANAPLINSWSFIEVFNNWAFFHSPSIPSKVKDSCGIVCNPTCPQ
eukprot:TRINITY_DN845_c0_g1_i1.p1 TRINITY_DN845_c0_g1~~TRINITY_DN845_c0_g1_i1.p1  ORF type:complete len:382 (-),score=88.24 TRINITY_DN845_c0_g1_i1:122-1267(-)